MNSIESVARIKNAELRDRIKPTKQQYLPFYTSMISMRYYKFPLFPQNNNIKPKLETRERRRSSYEGLFIIMF